VGKFGRVKLRSCPFSSFELAQLALDTRDNRENYYLGNRSELCRDQGCDALFFFTLAYLSKLSRFAVKWPYYISVLSPNGLPRDFWEHLTAKLFTGPLPSNALIGLNIKPPTYYLDPCKE
jgi:hypothetical protein